ncbi:unnamed protein product [Candidula unifasciata]|uniref:TMC domain-containing protein n=1 Tax=Candidula unifasciata TaxID=100452 RepID=A0A8S3YKR7_9EUPU|nr:unnamed protein product [Candidula unifasciata]
MRRDDSQYSEQPRQRHILRAENPLFIGVGDTDHSKHVQAHNIEIEPDYDLEYVQEYGTSIDHQQMEYDHDMEELLRQLPSRQLEDVAEAASRALWRKHLGSSTRQGTMRLYNQDDVENHIVETLRQDLQDTDQLYTELDAAVRVIPTTLSKKRTIKRTLSEKPRTRISRCKLIKYWFSLKWQKTKHKIVKETRLFDLWRSHLKTIEGCFGTSVVSYFIFLKWMLLVNIPIFMLTFAFLVIPHILFRYYRKDRQSVSYEREDFTGIEILTGTGYFEHSEMYYGFYTNETVEVASGYKYEMKYAYLLTSAGYYLFCLIILGYSYLRSYRKYYIEVSGSLPQYYFSLVICGWDYGITSQETAQLKQRSLFNEFKEYLAGLNTVKEKPTRRQAVQKWCIRLFVWVLVLALICASGYATYVVSTELSIKPMLANSTTTVVSSLTMPFVLSSIQLIVPMIFSFLEAYEQFSMPKYELYIHMLREQLLRAGMLAVLVYFWLKQASSQVKCWETFVGQELYRLTVMDMIFALLYSFFMEFIRRLCSLKWKSIERAEFAIARHTLELIYTQSLCWLGIFYSPLLPVVVILKLVITFYVKRYSVTQNCRPSLKPWRASQTHTVFVGYIFIFFIFTCIAVFFGIFEIKSSSDCGPYKSYETSYDVMKELISKWKKNYVVFGDIINIVTSSGFVAAVLVLLCMILYYSKTIMSSRKNRVEQFKAQLISEGKDKKFLLNLLTEVKVRGTKNYAKPGPAIPQTMQTPREPRDFF